MSWANPRSFLFLSFIALVVLLHILRLRRKDVTVSTLFLWDQVLRESRASSRLSRLLINIPLILQILALVALTFGLAEPFMIQKVPQRGDIILIMDTSASMKSRGKKGTKFEEAKQRAMELIEQLPQGNRMGIIEAGVKPIPRTSLTAEKSQLQRVIKEMEAKDTPGAMDKAILMALSLIERSRESELFLVSDGAFDSEQLQKLGGKKVRLILIEGGQKNIGITQFYVRQSGNYASKYEIMATIKNFMGDRVRVPFNLTLENVRLLRQEVDLAESEQKVIIFSYSGVLRGKMKAELDVQDDFPLDNAAFAILSDTVPMKVLLVSRGNYFLESLLSSYPHIAARRVEIIRHETAEKLFEEYDLVIFDRISPPPLAKGNFLLINTFHESLPLKVVGTVSEPVVRGWDAEHPLFQAADFNGIVIEEALQIRPAGIGKVLLASEATPLIYLIEDDGRRVIVVGFDFLKSDLPLRVAFPIFMGNLLSWLSLYGDKSERFYGLAGESYPLYVGKGAREILLTTPSKEKQTYQMKRSPFLFQATDEVGMYTFKTNHLEGAFAINLLNEEESNIAPRDHHVALNSTQGTSYEMAQAEKPMWSLFLLMTTLVIFSEWYFWCKEA
ncbi:MAG: VWA domain-containing protein [Candidatus Tectomicrobia bacterium]|nr:VWA domain-containing protein [Candidatus Tectomicrobia bacterium]